MAPHEGAPSERKADATRPTPLKDQALDVTGTPFAPPSGPPVGTNATPTAGPEQGSSRAEWPDPNADQPTVISASPPLDLPTTSLHSPNGNSATDDLVVLPTGAMFGPFRIETFVGGGGMGRVYRATDLSLDRPVAIKVLNRSRESDQEIVARFVNEARAAARLNHPNIAHVYYTGQHDGTHYIAFEYVEGVNIRAVVEQHGTLPLDRAVSYTLQIAQALRHASQRGIVHRDIKPSNVLVTPDDRVKLIDMGLARQLRPADASSDLTATGITLGTFDYISPEQARDPRTADVRSDIYSLGCTFFFMLTGRPPFPEGTMLQKLLQHQGDEPPDVRMFRPGLPEEVSRVLRKMLAKDPRHRFQDPDRLIEAIVMLAEELGIRPLVTSDAAWLMPYRSKAALLVRQLPWLVPMTLFLLAVFGLNFVWQSREGTVVDPPIPDQFVGVETHSDTATALGHGAPNGPRPPATIADGGLPSPATVVAASPGNGSGTEDTRLGPWSAPSPLGSSSMAGTTNGAGRLEFTSIESVGMSLGRTGERAGMSLSYQATPTTNPTTPAGGVVGDYVVERPGESPRGFASLSAAIEAAGDQGVVELRFNGQRSLKPLSLTNSSITLQAGANFVPRLVFAPSETDRLRSAQSVFTLSGGRLTLRNLRLELNIPRVPAERWSLIELGAGDRLELDSCVLTIRNAADGLGAYHQQASFFCVRQVADKPAASFIPATATPRASITLRRCFVRGEAVVLRGLDGRPFDWTVSDSILVTSENLLRVDGTTVPPGDQGNLRVMLDRVTAIAGPTLFRFDFNEFNPEPLPTMIHARQCILQTRNGAIVRHAGIANTDKAQGAAFAWRGEDNFYQQMGDPWIIRPLDALRETRVIRMDEWCDQRWAVTPIIDGVFWQVPIDENRPVHMRQPSDYAIDRARSYRLLDAKGEQRAGCDPALLPVPAPLEITLPPNADPVVGNPFVP